MGLAMETYAAIIERRPQTRLYGGHLPGFAGARAQGETCDGLYYDLQAVIAMLCEAGEAELESAFVGLHNVAVHGYWGRPQSASQQKWWPSSKRSVAKRCGNVEGGHEQFRDAQVAARRCRFIRGAIS